MKIKTLINRAMKFLNSDKRKQEQKTSTKLLLLNKLKEKQLELNQKLHKEVNEKSRRRIMEDLKIITAQRKKGLRQIKNLK